MPSDIAVYGLGVMGRNIALNMADHGLKVTVYNRTASTTEDFVAGLPPGSGIRASYELADLAASLTRPRVVFLMAKAGQVVDRVIEGLLPHLEPGDVIIDGGNSHFRDSQRRYEALRQQGIRFLGMGISGGEEGARHGPSIMPGGDPDAWPLVRYMFQDIAAKAEDGEPCCRWVGEGGAGHYVKMIHNGIEYAMMQAYGEGFELLREGPLPLDTAQVARLWGQGSVIRSWLLELAAAALTRNPDLKGIKGWVADSGEGRWALAEAIEQAVAAPALAQALFARFSSRRPDAYSLRLIAALRDEFGGHGTRPAGEKD